MVAAGPGEMPTRNERTISLQGCLAISAASLGASEQGRNLSTRGRQALSRRVDRGEWDEIEQGRHPVQQRFDGAGTREVEEDTVLVLFDLGCHFEEREDHGRGLRLGQRGLLQRLGAQGMMQDIGGTGQQKPHGVRQEGRRGGAVAVEVTLDRLDIVFTIPTRAVNLLIHPLRRGGCQGSDDKAWVVASGHHFRLEDDPPWLGPGGCTIGKRGIETAAVWRACVLGLRKGSLLLVQTARLLHDGRGVAQQDRIAGQAEDKIDPVPMGEHLDHLRGSKMAVPPDQDMGPGPVATQEGEEPHHDHGVLCAGGPRARAKAGRHQGA